MSELQELETQLSETLSRQATEVAEVQARHVSEVAEVQDQITVIKDGQLQELLDRGAELGFSLRVVENGKPAKRASKTGSTRKSATCKTCREAGLTGPHQRQRAVAALARSGLFEVEQHRGRKPVVRALAHS